jgi:hypothetical protein
MSLEALFNLSQDWSYFEKPINGCAKHLLRRAPYSTPDNRETRIGMSCA